MSARAAALIVVGALACSAPPRAPLAKAGDARDDGAGLLARASIQLQTPDEHEARFVEPRARRVFDVGSYGGSPYGGDPYGGFGGASYGGTSYANWRMPQWSYTVPNRMPHYRVSVALFGAIEGTVTWNGQLPPKVSSACGPIDNPTLRVTNDRAVRGVIVYIEEIKEGRPLPYYSRPASVGGMLAKHGCTLVPAAQIVAPLPGSVSIHGDAHRTKLRIAGKTHELQEAGLVQVAVQPGVTRIDGEDGTLASAWVLALETPYYAITDDRGRFRIDDLAPGTYELTFWQPPIASTNPDGTWSFGRPIVIKRKVRVGMRTAHVSVALTPR